MFQPELRRALDRIGRVGSLGWLMSAEARVAEVVATEVPRAAALLSAERHGALIVIERETGLEQIAETGVMIHGDLSADLLRTIFSPKSPLHDGAVIIRGERVLAAGALLPLGETTIHAERFGTRHRAALGTPSRPTRSSSSSPRRTARSASSSGRGSSATSARRSWPGRSGGSSSPPGPARSGSAGRAGAGAPRLSDIGRAVRSARRSAARSSRSRPTSR